MHWVTGNNHTEVLPTVAEFYLSNPDVFEHDFLKDHQLRRFSVEQSQNEPFAILFFDLLESPDIRWSTDIVSVDKVVLLAWKYHLRQLNHVVWELGADLRVQNVHRRQVNFDSIFFKVQSLVFLCLTSWEWKDLAIVALYNIKNRWAICIFILMDRLDRNHQISLKLHGLTIILDLEVICFAYDVLSLIKDRLWHNVPTWFFMDLTNAKVRQLSLTKEILHFSHRALIKEPTVWLINSIFLHIDCYKFK